MFVGMSAGGQGSGTKPVGKYTFFYGNGNESHELGTGSFVHKTIKLAVKRAEFVSDRISYIILRGRWSQIIVLNVHAPAEDKIDDMQDNLCEEMERDKTDCSNYCGITWLSISYKILSTILLSKLNQYIDEINGDHQCGFEHNRCTTYQIFCILRILEKKMGVHRDRTSAIHRLQECL
jgi:hypothetical protein